MTCILLLKGANPNIANMGGAMPISIAIRMGFTKIKTVLVRCGATIPRTDENMSYKKLQSGMTNNELEPTPPTNHTQGLFGSFSASKATKMSYAEVLDTEAKDLVQSAIETNVMILPDAAYLGLDQALNGIIMTENIEDQDEEGSTMLMKASYMGHHAIVKHLLLMNCDADAIDKNGNTAMVWAAIGGHFEIVKALHENGASLDGAVAYCKKNGINLKGQITPLIAASYYGHLPIVQYLAIEKCDINIRCGPGKGKSAVAIAAWTKKKDIVNCLLQYKAYVDPGVDNWLIPGIVKLKKLEQEKNAWIGSELGVPQPGSQRRKTSLQDKLVYFTAEDNELVAEIRTMLATRAGVHVSRLNEITVREKPIRASMMSSRNTSYRQGMNLEVIDFLIIETIGSKF
jgi:hypothetical protein